MTIIDPHLRAEDDFAVYAAAKERGLLVRKADNSSHFEGDCWPGRSAWVDYLQPAAREYWASRFLPDAYVGSVDVQQQTMWVVDDSDDQQPRMVHKQISYAPGLYKIFDEIIVNAADNIQRDPRGMTQIKVTIDQAKGTIKVWNNGRGIPPPPSLSLSFLLSFSLAVL